MMSTTPAFHIDPPAMAPADMSETAIQRQMLVMVRRLFPECLIAHVPNGGKRHKLEAAHLKANGVLAGFPDLVITWLGGAAFCEVKDRDGKVSKDPKKDSDQERVLSDLHNQGHPVGVFRHDRTLHDFLRRHGAPFKPKWPHQFLPEPT